MNERSSEPPVSSWEPLGQEIYMRYIISKVVEAESIEEALQRERKSPVTGIQAEPVAQNKMGFDL